MSLRDTDIFLCALKWCLDEILQSAWKALMYDGGKQQLVQALYTLEIRVGCWRLWWRKLFISFILNLLCADCYFNPHSQGWIEKNWWYFSADHV